MGDTDEYDPIGVGTFVPAEEVQRFLNATPPYALKFIAGVVTADVGGNTNEWCKCFTRRDLDMLYTLLGYARDQITRARAGVWV